jgi:hypothetical protein
MTKDELIAEAKKLSQPSQKASLEFTEKKIKMVELTNQLLLNSKGFEDAVSGDKVDMMKDNINNQFKFMESIYINYNPEVFVNIIAWAFHVYLSHGFDKKFWDFLFPVVLKVYHEQLSEGTYAELAGFYNWMEKHKEDFLRLHPPGSPT